MSNIITLAHGGGGRLQNELIRQEIVTRFSNSMLNSLPDGAVTAEKLVISSDSFVITPRFFPSGNIGKLAMLFQLTDAVNDTIKLNLLLAFIYNIMLIPLAAGVFYSLIHWQFNPVISAIAMSGSCLLVVSNSLRLWKIKLQIPR